MKALPDPVAVVRRSRPRAHCADGTLNRMRRALPALRAHTAWILAIVCRRALIILPNRLAFSPWRHLLHALDMGNNPQTKPQEPAWKELSTWTIIMAMYAYSERANVTHPQQHLAWAFPVLSLAAGRAIAPLIRKRVSRNLNTWAAATLVVCVNAALFYGVVAALKYFGFGFVFQVAIALSRQRVSPSSSFAAATPRPDVKTRAPRLTLPSLADGR